MSNGDTVRSTYLYIVVPAFCLMLLCGLSAKAEPISGNVVIDIVGTDGNTTGTDQIVIPVQPDGTWGVQNQESNKSLWEATVSASGNVDPFTNLAFGVTNIAAVPLEFTFAVTMPIAPIAIGTLHGGSVGGSVNDANNDGLGGLSTITSVPGTPFYAGLIDAVTVLSIYPDPTSFGFPFAFPGENISIPSVNAGLPGPTLPSGPALISIGIENKFLLSPGDSMSATSFFVVEPIPEPSSIVLAVLGGAGLLLWVRRRRRQ